MKKNPVIFKLLIRYIKENGLFYEYRRFFSQEYLDNALLEINLNYRDKLLLYQFRFKNPHAKTINNLLTESSHEFEFNKILCYYLKDKIKFFLKENNVYEDFIKYRKAYINRYGNTENYSCDEEVIGKYIDKLANENYSIKDFIFYAFSWSFTDNPYIWNDIHNKYIEYILNILTK